MARYRAGLPMLIALTLAVPGCSKGTTGGASPAGGGGAGATGCDSNTNVCVTEQDFSITTVPTTKPAGSVAFSVLNNGPSSHELVVLKTDLAPDALPTTSGGAEVDVTGNGVTESGSIPSITPNSIKQQSMQLEAGKYVLICNLPGHYKLGMRFGFTVS